MTNKKKDRHLHEFCVVSNAFLYILLVIILLSLLLLFEQQPFSRKYKIAMIFMQIKTGTPTIINDEVYIVRYTKTLFS